MISKLFLYLFPGIDWPIVFHRVMKRKVPHMIIRDFCIIPKICQSYFLFNWKNIQHKWGGWQCVRCDEIKEYHLIYDTLTIILTFKTPRHRTRNCSSVRIIDTKTEHPVGPRYDLYTSVWQFVKVLQWAEAHVDSKKH